MAQLKRNRIIPGKKAHLVVKRQQWKQKEIRRSIWAFILSISAMQLMFVPLIGVIVAIGIGAINIVPNLQPLLLGFAVLLALVDLALVTFSYFSWQNFRYILKAGSYKMLKDMVDKKPGKIISKSGVVSQKMTITPVSNFSEVEASQNILQGIFNFGNVILTNKAAVDMDRYGSAASNRFVIRNIDDPATYVLLIQDMIDNARGGIEIDESVLKLQDNEPPVKEI